MVHSYIELFVVDCNYKGIRSSSSEVDGSSFVFEEEETIKTQLQTILKLDLGVKWLHVGVRRTTTEQN